MRDPYEVLGVPRGASAHDIKSAFRKLAKKHHPDANVKDPKAAGRFAELNAAYEILGDEKQRAAFDRGEIDAEGKPRFSGFEGFPGAGGRGPGGGDAHFESFSFGPDGFRRSGQGFPGGGMPGMDDLLSGIFGGTRAGSRPFEPADFGGPGKGADAQGRVALDLADAVKGTRARVRLSTGKEVEVTIPPGSVAGKPIRLKGQGFPSPAGMPGDAFVTVDLVLPEGVSIDGVTLKADVPISLEDAVLGGKVRVPTATGTVELTIPPGTTGARVFRLKGKGLPQGDGGAGDLLATPRIVLSGPADPELEALMRKRRPGPA
jgi:DnaJ-class molecular chaperone